MSAGTKSSAASQRRGGSDSRQETILAVVDSGEEERLRRTLREERLRVSRELHDGPLQSLAGAALQLDALARVLGGEARGIRKRLREIQQVLLEEERDIRAWIQSMRDAALDHPTPGVDAAPHITRLCRRVQRQWGLPVQVTIRGGRLPVPAMRDQVYRLVQEALMNVVKHARATTAQVERHLLEDRVRIVVRDNGRGFPFHGRHDLAALDEHGVGPVSIKDRVAAMSGQLVVTSGHDGACLEIELPLRLRALSEQGPAVRPGSR